MTEIPETMGSYLFNHNGGGGFSIDSFMKSPIITLNHESSLKGGDSSKTVTEHLKLGNSLAIPSWVLSHNVNTSSNEIYDNFKDFSSDYENTSFIDDDIHDKLLELVEADIEGNSITKTKTKKQPKHRLGLHAVTRSHKPKPKPNKKTKKHSKY
jgi:hypothetical protein